MRKAPPRFGCGAAAAWVADGAAGAPNCAAGVGGAGAELVQPASVVTPVAAPSKAAPRSTVRRPVRRRKNSPDVPFMPLSFHRAGRGLGAGPALHAGTRRLPAASRRIL